MGGIDVQVRQSQRQAEKVACALAWPLMAPVAASCRRV